VRYGDREESDERLHFALLNPPRRENETGVNQNPIKASPTNASRLNGTPTPTAATQ
jgi:hypothetical protein